MRRGQDLIVKDKEILLNLALQVSLCSCSTLKELKPEIAAGAVWLHSRQEDGAEPEPTDPQPG